MGKQRMSNKKMLLIWSPILAVFLAIIIAGTAVANFYANYLDTYLGRGTRNVIVPEGTEDWDTNYYTNTFNKASGAEGTQEAAAKTAQKIADEGTVLLKNTGVLPLGSQSKVAPFGLRYSYPFYGGTGSGNMNAADSYVVTPQKALEDNFTVVDTFANVNNDTDVKKYIYDTSVDNDLIKFFIVGGDFNGSNQSLFEFDSSVYKTENVGKSDTTGVVFIGRSGGENDDLFTRPYNKVQTIKASMVSATNANNVTASATADTSAVKHALDLMPEEKNMIALAKDKCKNVVVVINSSNALELGSLADDSGIGAILWIGGPGGRGYQSMSDIMAGKVNPSGRTVDVFVRDLTQDPALKNLGDLDGYIYANSAGLGPVPGKHYGVPRQNGGTNPMTYVEYAEGVYLGYKYYETAHDDGLTGFAYGELNANGSVKTSGQVVYPFGYGLSYTTFKQEITSFSGNKDKVRISVKVTNTDEKAGKETVQVYLTAPYTEYDKQNGVEKPTAVLAGFAKTKMLAKNESDTVTIEFDIDEFASYNSKRDNGDGTKGCYMLDGGKYTVSVRKNSHEFIGTKADSTREFTISETFFDNSNPRKSEKDGQAQLDNDGKPLNYPAKAVSDTSAKFVAATNQFDDSTKYMSENSKILTRSTANGLSLASITEPDKYGKNAPQWVLDKLKTFDPVNDDELGSKAGTKVHKETAPTEKADTKLVLSSLRGLDYYDRMWDELLDQLDYSDSQVKVALYQISYAIKKIDSIGLSDAVALDGPQGLTLARGFDKVTSCAYPSAPIIAATFNVDLAYEMGVMVGSECYFQGSDENKLITAWYAPGVNTHRTAFSGRNFEYYSEDGVLAGKICARVVSGSADMGVAAHIKHFALNDHDSNRSNICVWATEQTIREVYLKPFEIVVKEARQTLKYIGDENGAQMTKVIRGSTGIMTAYNNIGATFTSAHYGLNTAVLRNEWGFQGAVISDMTSAASGTWVTSEMVEYYKARRDQMIRSGNDYVLTPDAARSEASDFTTPTAKWAMRNAVHNIAYMVTNSNAMQGAAPGAIVYYSMSPWMIWLIVANVIIYTFIAAVAVLLVLRVLHSKKNPEKYKSKNIA